MVSKPRFFEVSQDLKQKKHFLFYILISVIRQQRIFFFLISIL